MPLWLIGMMGSGKSTIGHIISRRLGWTFIDTNELISEAAGRSIRDIFSAEGEAGFRTREIEAVAAASSEPGAVVATGGGAILSPRNVRVMRRTGRVFWLQAEPSTLAARLEGSGDGSRPLIFEADTEHSLGDMLEARTQRYRMAADFAIGTDLLSPEEAADLVEALWLD